MTKGIFFGILFLYLILFRNEIILSQDLHFKLEKITPEHGLSHHTVKSIVQDKKGFIWFGTDVGLNRFDGYSFKVYLKNDSCINSLSDNMINDLYCDSNGDIWIGTTGGGLNRFKLKSDSIICIDKSSDLQSFTIYRNAIIEDSNNQLWVGYANKGLHRINLNTGETKIYQNNPLQTDSLISNNIQSLFLDSQGIIWIGTRDGYITRFNPKNEYFTKFRINNSVEQIMEQDAAWVFYEDSYGVFWVGTEDALYTYDKEKEVFEQQLKSDGGNQFLVHGFITNLLEDKNGNIWASSESGMYFYFRSKNKFIHLSEHPEYGYVFKNKSVISLFMDKSGIIWAGVQGEGIYKIDLTVKEFYTKKHQAGNPNSLSAGLIRSIYYDDKENLWIGNIQNGVSVFANNKKLIHFKAGTNTGELTNNDITSITQDKKDNYWLATEGGGINIVQNFSLKNPTKSKITHIRHNSNDISSLRSDNVTYIYRDYENKIWVGTRTGLDFYNEQNNSFIHVDIKQQRENILRNVQTNCILKDKTGAIWVGCWRGLIRFEYSVSNNGFKIKNYQYFRHNSEYKYSISDNRITDLCEDVNGNIWVGTYGGGLNKIQYSPDSKNEYNKYIIKNYTIDDGLASNEIFCIEIDKYSCLWMSTNSGLSKFDIEREVFRKYDTGDGLLGESFYWGASYKARGGQLFFGSTKGLNIFYPEKIKANNYVPDIVFTDLKIDNIEVRSGEYSTSKMPLNYANELIIPYSYETFTIEFASLHYSYPNKNKYKYILEPYNKNWVEKNANHRFATYSNLNPGTYTFKLIATNNDGIWSKKPVTIKITILPPYWKTLWFRLLSIISLVAIIIMAYKLRIKRIKWQNKRLESLVSIKTAELRKKNEEVLIQNEEIAQQNKEIRQRNEEITQQSETVIKQRDEIIKKNEELNQYRNHLEELIIKRTEDLIKEKENAELADKLKTSFLENISHEIRTPLNAIVGFSTLFEQSGNLNKDQHNCIVNINRGSKSLIGIIESILQVSKLHAGQQKLKISEFYIADALWKLYKDSMDLLEFRSKTSLKLQFELSNELENRLVVSDKMVITIVLRQLIDNSIKFTNEGEVSFGVLLNEKNNLCFFVKDTGIGIDNEDIKFIFDKFRKVETDKSKLYRGLGIGLSIAKSMVELLDGHIWCESEPNKGSVFYFTCPIETKSKSYTSAFTKEPTGKVNVDLKGKKILIAEDEELNYYLLELVMRKAEAIVFWARNGKEAIELFAKNQDIDLILMDIKMPVISGTDAMKKIREKYNNKVPVIAQTAYTLANEKVKIVDSGFDAYIEKPIDINKLFKLIAEQIA